MIMMMMMMMQYTNILNIYIKLRFVFNRLIEYKAICMAGLRYWVFRKYKLLYTFLISNFLRVLDVVCFLLGNSPASEFYIPTFRNTLSHRHRQIGTGTPTCL